MIIPYVNSKGKFKFSEPFDKNLHEDEILTVVAIRDIHEQVESGEDPFANIYELNGLTKEDMENDIDNNIPIVVFRTIAGKYYYVPANRINSIPVVSGHVYQDKALVINLGAIPEDMNLDMIKEDIKELIEGTIGIRTQVIDKPISTKILKSEVEHKDFIQTLNTRVTNDSSYFSKYISCKKERENYIEIIKNLECAVKVAIEGNAGLLTGYPLNLPSSFPDDNICER